MPDGAPKLHDVDAERTFLASLLVYRGRVGDVAALLDSGDFFSPAHAQIFGAMVALHNNGEPVDIVTIGEYLRRLGSDLGTGTLAEIQGDPNVVNPNRSHVNALIALRAARDLDGAVRQSLEAVQRGADPYTVSEDLIERLSNLQRLGIVPDGLSTFSEFLDSEDSDAPVVVPGIAYQDTRVVVVSTEGSGKSTWLRQIAFCAAQGIHPFKFTAIEPVQVLVVDLENPTRELRQSGNKLRHLTRRHTREDYDPSRLHLLHRPQGGDLRDRRFRAEIEGAIEMTRPKLVTIGPINKMAYRKSNETHEDLAEATQRILDDLRIRYGFALFIEAHAPHGDSFKRELRPMNSMRWLSWPDVVLGLRGDERGFEVEHARGDRGKFEWPERFDRHGAWPFVGGNK